MHTAEWSPAITISIPRPLRPSTCAPSPGLLSQTTWDHHICAAAVSDSTCGGLKRGLVNQFHMWSLSSTKTFVVISVPWNFVTWLQLCYMQTALAAHLTGGSLFFCQVVVFLLRAFTSPAKSTWWQTKSLDTMSFMTIYTDTLFFVMMEVKVDLISFEILFTRFVCPQVALRDWKSTLHCTALLYCRLTPVWMHCRHSNI